MSASVYLKSASNPEQQNVLESLAEALQCDFSGDRDNVSEGALVVGYSDDRLSVFREGSKDKPITVDFVGGKADHRRKFGGGKSQDIAKAAGLNKGVKPSIIDGTGGLGGDAFVLASLGCQVTIIERSPVIAALLADGLQRARQDGEVGSIAERMSLIQGDAVEVMQVRAQQKETFDVVYLDPMFPHREKSALVKKEMRVFQALLGHDSDADQLLAPAMKLAEYRVVIKRPKGAPDLASMAPTYRLEGKACRYDIHALKAFSLR